ncbi:hypothetical protein [Gaopeijia maritima]|uniref:Uncharacterized protein n=1 Tax=Gaopeijia maritima TaxID=3119007 RepID=A0ABU9EDJ8_9BACT
MIRSSFAPLAAALLLFAPIDSGVAAQVEAAPAMIPQDSVQIALARFQSLQQELTTLQQEVMNASPQLQEQQAEVSGAVESAVSEIDPSLQADMEARMPVIQQEAQAAQAAGDTTALVALEQEFMTLRGRAETAQQEAVERPAIAAQIEAFEEALRTEMATRDPEVESTLAELEVLAGRLDATLGGG